MGAGPDSKTERAGAQNAELPCGPRIQEGLLRCARWEHSSNTHQTHSHSSGPSVCTQLVRSGALSGARLLAPLMAAGLAAGGNLNADTMTQR